MSLDVYLMPVPDSPLYRDNITHNLGHMASHIDGLYEALWRPDANGFTTASQLIPVLQGALATLQKDPARFRRYEPTNGWGSLEDLIRFIQKYLAACEAHPDARVEVSR